MKDMKLKNLISAFVFFQLIAVLICCIIVKIIFNQNDRGSFVTAAACQVTQAADQINISARGGSL